MRGRKCSRRWCAGWAVAMALGGVARAGDTYYFQHIGGGDWDSTSDPYFAWYDATTSSTLIDYPPDGLGATANIFQLGTTGQSGISVIYNHVYSATGGVFAMTVASGNTVVQSSPSSVLVVGNGGETVGYGGLSSITGPLSGTYTQSAGINQVTGTGQFSVVRGSVYNLSGSGTVLTPFLALVGSTFNQSGGTVSVSSSMYDSDAGPGFGSSFYNLSGGSLSVTGVEYLGYGFSGTFTQSGNSSHTVNGTFYVGQPGGTPPTFTAGGGNTYNLQGGTLNVTTLSVTDIPQAAGGVLPGVFNQTGGTLIYNTFNQSGGQYIGTLINKWTYNYSGGTFTGRLVNQGTVNFNADFLASNGMENDTSFELDSGRTITLSGSGFDNEGTANIFGGTIAGGSIKTNNSQIYGYGTIAGAGTFTNNGLISQSGGALALQFSGGAYFNLGNIQLQSGQQLRLVSPANTPAAERLINRGTVALNGAIVTGTGGLVNDTGGTLSGSGTISTGSFVNNAGGYIALDSGTLNVTTGVSNAGVIALNGPTASVGGGAITNSGTVQGYGNVASSLTNSGTVEALGGTLLLSGSTTNQSAGLMTASAGNKLLVTGAGSGLASNAGTINLTGGTFDNGGKAMTNTGQISGYGNFRTGAAGLTNGDGAGHGSMTLTGGVTTVDGNVTNAVGSNLNVKYNPTIFTGSFVNNGTVKITGTSVTFAGSFTNSGAYSSDPATNSFAELTVSANGYLLGGEGDVFNVSGDFINNSSRASAWDTAGALLALQGSPVHRLAVAGRDLGASADGYTNNFSFGELMLASGESLVLEDGNTDAGAALYVKALSLADGVGQVSSITGNGFNMYYDPAASGNAYLGGMSYALAGGGEIAPTPEPSGLGLVGAGATILLRRSRRAVGGVRVP